jgi:hypothetical protein
MLRNETPKGKPPIAGIQHDLLAPSQNTGSAKSVANRLGNAGESFRMLSVVPDVSPRKVRINPIFMAGGETGKKNSPAKWSPELKHARTVLRGGDIPAKRLDGNAFMSPSRQKYERIVTNK